MQNKRVLVELGICTELVIDDGNQLITFTFRATKKDSFILCCSPSGKEIFIFLNRPMMVKNKNQFNAETIKRAAGMYKKWSEFEAGKMSGYKNHGKKLKKAGSCDSITYKSDKWTGKKTAYIHDFKNLNNLSVDNLDNPTMFKIGGKSVTVDADGIKG